MVVSHGERLYTYARGGTVWAVVEGRLYRWSKTSARAVMLLPAPLKGLPIRWAHVCSGFAGAGGGGRTLCSGGGAGGAEVVVALRCWRRMGLGLTF